MNSDLVLRARLVQQGYSDDEISKFLPGASKLPGGGKLSQLPIVGGMIHRNRAEMGKDEYNAQVREEKARKKQDWRNRTSAAIRQGAY